MLRISEVDIGDIVEFDFENNFKRTQNLIESRHKHEVFRVVSVKTEDVVFPKPEPYCFRLVLENIKTGETIGGEFGIFCGRVKHVSDFEQNIKNNYNI